MNLVILRMERADAEIEVPYIPTDGFVWIPNVGRDEFQAYAVERCVRIEHVAQGHEVVVPVIHYIAGEIGEETILIGVSNEANTISTKEWPPIARNE